VSVRECCRTWSEGRVEAGDGFARAGQVIGESAQGVR
jgi:hypothetical protein